MTVKTKWKESDYLDLSDKPKNKEGLPIGSKCNENCLKPPINSNWAHCSTCHFSFRALGFFDSHRSNGKCLNPQVLGLMEVDKLWSTPEGHEQRTALAARSAKMREGRQKAKPHSVGDSLEQKRPRGRPKGSGKSQA